MFAVCIAVQLDAGILEIFLCLCDEFIACDVEDDSVDRLEIKAFVVDVNDLCESESCRVILLFLF